jgi:IS5 family transposase
MAGLSILKPMHNLSDEDLCARWIENPYYQLFCGEEFFRHKLTFDRSSLTRWRQRMGEERLTALIQESLAVAAKPADFSKVIIDTTVQPKAVAFPTDAKLMHRARERLVKLARKTGVELRQSYARVGKHALIAHQRYAHAKQFKRANRALRTIRTYLGRVTRDIIRKIRGEAELESVFAHPLMPRPPGARAAPASARTQGLFPARARGRMHRQGQGPSPLRVRRQGLATTVHRSRGGQFIAHAKTLPGNPYDGHTLAAVIPEIETQIGLTSPASSPTAAIAVTTPRLVISSRSISPARDLASPRPSNANSAAARRSNPSSDMPRPSIAWAETISLEPTATAPTPSSPQPATTSDACSNGWLSCCP